MAVLVIMGRLHGDLQVFLCANITHAQLAKYVYVLERKVFVPQF
jgi:hypothetical protein